MDYIMTALGIVIIVALIGVLLVLCPIVFNLAVIAIDEFIKMCQWIRHKVKMRDYNANHDIILSQTQYDILMEHYHIYHNDTEYFTDDELEDILTND